MEQWYVHLAGIHHCLLYNLDVYKRQSISLKNYSLLPNDMTELLQGFYEDACEWNLWLTPGIMFLLLNLCTCIVWKNKRYKLMLTFLPLYLCCLLYTSFSIDYSDLNAVVGDADYVFVGTVASEEGTVYKDAVTVETDDGKTREVSGPYTNYTVNVTKNIKGNLVTDTAIPIQKSGGLSEDGSQYFVYEGDELPVVGNEYIFFAYAQPDGSLLISGPVSNMSVSDNTSDIAPFSDSTEYSDIVDAYNNQVDSGRTRFTSSYEAK